MSWPGSSRLPGDSGRDPQASKAIYGAIAVVVVLWIATGAALSTRIHLIFGYDTIATVTPALEILAVSPTAFISLMFGAVVFIACARCTVDKNRVRLGLIFGFAATLPIGFLLARSLVESLPEPAIWEVGWYAVFTGLAFGQLARFDASKWRLPAGLWYSVLIAAVIAAFSWWLFQSHWYYANFRLGFNDFGHFTQRIANTAAGRGFLLETPVLTTFWDHFNPGLVLLVPVWMLWPSVYLVFVVQSLSLAVPALVLASIVRKQGGSCACATLWGFAWLTHPAIGQMNIAYTYGWHPVTVAVPLLLLAYRLLLSSRFVGSALVTLIACSFEEGVIVVVGCFAAAMAIRSLKVRSASSSVKDVLSVRSWCAVYAVMTVSFVVVYTMSGLATFQTGRFSMLGGSALEIGMSPILKPAEFWELLFRFRNAAFLSMLLAPFLVSVTWQSRWHFLAVALPVCVLLVWEHMPAQSIAFQYTACLIPILFLGIVGNRIDGGEAQPKACRGGAVASLATGCLLCLFVGQMPWSEDNLVDVLSRTYAPEQTAQRLIGSPDNQWLSEQIEAVRNMRVTNTLTGGASAPRVLATGRIAAHMVGLPDVETVSQFWQRYGDLAKIDTALSSPMLRYDVLVIDFTERFQQTEEETIRVRDEAVRLGFRVTQSQFDVQVLVIRQK